MSANVELIAAYWTIAGDVFARGPTEVSPFAFRARVEAASRAGYRGMGLLDADLCFLKARHGFKEMSSILQDHGIHHVELEFLGDWFAHGDRKRRSDEAKARLLEAAAALGARHIKAAPDIEGNDWPTDHLVESFIALCRDAANHGTAIALEIMPFSNLRTVDAALAVIEGAAQANGGLLLDIWHFARGGIDYQEVERIPSHYIKAVELDDAENEPAGTLWEDTIHHRKLCGEGHLEPQRFIQQLMAVGYQGPYGVEILSEEHRKRDLQDAATLSFQTALQQFNLVGAASTAPVRHNPKG
jgi:sugar phosphate isomerase/epimerase